MSATFVAQMYYVKCKVEECKLKCRMPSFTNQPMYSVQASTVRGASNHEKLLITVLRDVQILRLLVDVYFS